MFKIGDKIRFKKQLYPEYADCCYTVTDVSISKQTVLLLEDTAQDLTRKMYGRSKLWYSFALFELPIEILNERASFWESVAE